MSKRKVVKKPRNIKSSVGVPKGLGSRFNPERREFNFKVGNKIWQQRTKHGREALFSSAALLEQEAATYFQWCDDNPWMVNEARTESHGSGGGSSTTIVEVPAGRPYTWPALCSYLGCSESYFRTFKSTHKDGPLDFLTVIEWIEQTIYNQKFEGASIGVFNANIISRDLGLVDKQSTEHSIADDSKKHFPFGEG